MFIDGTGNRYYDPYSGRFPASGAPQSGPTHRDPTLPPPHDHVVQPHDTLASIGARYGVPLDELIRANPQVRNSDPLDGEEVVHIPIVAKTAAATRRPYPTSGSEAVDRAATAAEQARKKLQEMRDLAARDNGAARAELHDGYLQRDLAAKEAALKKAVLAELGERTEQLRTQPIVDQVGRDIAARYDDPRVRAVVDSAVSEFQASRGVDESLRALRSGKSPDRQAALVNAVDAEIKRHAGPDPRPGAVDRVGNEIIGRYDGDPAAQSLVRAAVAEVRAQREVATILAHAAAGDTPQAKAERLKSGFAGASPEARQRLLSDPRTNAIIDEAVAYANEPLGRIPANQQSLPNPYPHTKAAVTRLEELTRGMDPQLASRVIERALPAYEEVRRRYDGDRTYENSIFDVDGTRIAAKLAQHMWDTEPGLVQRIVALGAPAGVKASPNTFGLSPAYVLELGRQAGIDIRVASYPVVAYQNATAAADRYFQHMEELSYLLASSGKTMTPEQLDRAIAKYVSSKGPQWQVRLEELQADLANSGRQLLNDMQRLEAAAQALPPAERDKALRQIAEPLQDPRTQAAIGMALNEKPELMRGAHGRALLKTLAALGVKGPDNPLAVTVVTTYLRENVLQAAQHLDVSDPASLAKGRADLAAALRDNDALATMLGITPQQFEEVAEGLIALVPQSAGGVDTFAAGSSLTLALHEIVDKIDTRFRNTPFSRTLRTVSFAVAGATALNAIHRHGETPTLRNFLDAAANSALTVVEISQLSAAIGGVGKDSSLAKVLGSAGRLMWAVSVGLAAYDTVDRFRKGDWVGAGLTATTGAGIAWGTFGTFAHAGPVGFGIAVTAIAATYVHDKIREAAHNSRFETDTTVTFLKEAGFNDVAARKLMDQSPQGHSVVPLLLRYGELHGMSAQQTVAWVNSIEPDKLGVLRNKLHGTVDAIGGDVSRFQLTGAGDAAAAQRANERPGLEAGFAVPLSGRQLDTIVGVLGVPLPG